MVLSVSSGVLGTITDAPFSLNALLVRDAFGDTSTLMWPIVQFYIMQSMTQVRSIALLPFREAYAVVFVRLYGPLTTTISPISLAFPSLFSSQGLKILGSVEALGNPVSLVNGLGSGVREFFYHPAQGLASSPKDFGTGLAKGTTALVSSFGAGVFGAASSVLGSVGKGAAVLTMDNDFVARRNAANTQRVEHVGQGVLRGAQALGTGLASGLAGIFLDPLRGARRAGVKGFFEGLGKGMVGVFAKTAVGAVDFVSITLKGIGATFELIGGRARPLGRRRLPRFIAAGESNGFRHLGGDPCSP